MTDTTTTEATEAVVLLEGRAREAAVTLVEQGNALFTSLTEGSLSLLNATLDIVVKLQPMLNRQLDAVKREHGDDAGAGRLIAHMRAVVASIGDENVTWKLDANTTFLAASFKRDRKAWGSYRNHVIGGRRDPSFKRFAAYQGRFLLGHYDEMGNLTQAGVKADAAKAKADFVAQTVSLTMFDEVDFSNVLDAEPTKADELKFFHLLAYWANAQVLTMERELKVNDSGRKIVNDVRANVNDKLIAAHSKRGRGTK